MSPSVFIRRTVIMLLCMLSFSYYASAQNPDWSRPYKPFRIAGNVYYVGTYDLACYLITTPSGHILINTALDSTVDILQANVEALGFKFTDIKMLLISQAHFDHTGGLAEIKRRTGAEVFIDEKDAQVVADGGHSDFLWGGKGIGSLFTPVTPDRQLPDHAKIVLGGTIIELLHHPGHTKGACSYLVTTHDEQRSYNLLIANIPYMLDEVILPGMPTYPDVGKDFKYTYAAMRQVDFDIWVAAHASQFGLHTVHKEGDAYNPAAFGNKKLYYATIKDMEGQYKERMKAARRAKK